MRVTVRVKERNNPLFFDVVSLVSVNDRIAGYEENDTHYRFLIEGNQITVYELSVEFKSVFSIVDWRCA